MCSFRAIHKLCNAEFGEGGPARCYHTIFLLLKQEENKAEFLIEVNQNFDRKCYMRGRGRQKWFILALHNLWTAPFVI